MRCFACGTEKDTPGAPIQYSPFFEVELCIDRWEEHWALRHPGTFVWKHHRPGVV